MEKHIAVLGWLYIIFSVFGVLFFFAVPIMFSTLTILGIAIGEQETMGVLAIIGTVLAAFFLVISPPGIIGGTGLLKHQDWARILVLILGFLNLLNIPFGTALGIYTIWVLWKDETIKLFARSH